MTVTKKGTRGPVGFEQRFSDAALLGFVKAVVTHAEPEKPASISQRRFDATRADAGHPQCPRASYIARRLNRSWPELVRLTLDEESNQFQALVARGRAEGDSASREDCIAALRLVARRTKAESLRPEQYDEERAALIRGSRGRERQSLEERLPSVEQIRRFGFKELAAAAGLTVAQPTTKERGLPARAAIERFLVAQGYLPSLRELERFSKEQSFALRRHRGSLDPLVKELRQERQQQGVWTPAKPPPQNKRPPWQEAEEESEAVGGSAPRSARKGHWTLELVEAGLDEAVAKLAPGERLNQPTLRRLARGSRTIPTASTVTRIAKAQGTTFSSLRDAAVVRSSRA